MAFRSYDSFYSQAKWQMQGTEIPLNLLLSISSNLISF